MTTPSSAESTSTYRAVQRSSNVPEIRMMLAFFGLMNVVIVLGAG